MVERNDGKEQSATTRPALGRRTGMKVSLAAILLAIALACAAPTPPVVTITSPLQDEQVKGSITLKIDLQVSSGRLDEFTLLLDGAQRGQTHADRQSMQ
jgi:hypothetical protein